MERVVQAYLPAERVRVVMDNLNTPTLRCQPEKAKASLKRLEFHHRTK
jgi:hypothetical protein